jgi:hypothetical protein
MYLVDDGFLYSSACNEAAKLISNNDNHLCQVIKALINSFGRPVPDIMIAYMQ